MSRASDGGAGSAAIAPVAYPKRWAAAFVMMIAALLDLIDASIVNTALPSIGRSLHAAPAELEWTVSAYMLGFAATLIIAGHLGDRFGRKRLFLTGVACFALASAGSAIAADPGQLIAARAVQGVAAAALLPQVLGSLRTMFDGAARAKVFALFGVTAGVANAAGVLLGGVLTDWDLFGWGWRTVFAVNLPIAAGVLLLGAKWIPTSRERTGGRIDVAGNLILALCLVAIVLPLVEGRSNDWPLWGWICLPGGVLALAALVGYESWRRIEHPLLPAALFQRPAFGAGLLVQLLLGAGMSGFFLVFTIWLQAGQGYTPSQAGVLMIAMSAGAFISAPVVVTLVAKIGRNILVIGNLLMAGGLLWVQYALNDAAPRHTGAWPLVPGLLVAGIGLGFVVVPLVDIVLTAVPERLAGGASGIFSTAQQFGGALGVAIIGNLFFTHTSRGLTGAIVHAAPWAIGAFLICAVLCLGLPGRNRPRRLADSSSALDAA
ncbi:MFS transporter [Nonomuraea guangzhouensis]|uniref:MFS transporter n=1 Tax=Nonomuraea guangzhouensis TaxID=1291555 RepID=A0ABW4G8B2_9ACTN|nr:MFS transporter [Nonomuraea guangzhouensis]